MVRSRLVLAIGAVVAFVGVSGFAVARTGDADGPADSAQHEATVTEPTATDAPPVTTTVQPLPTASAPSTTVDGVHEEVEPLRVRIPEIGVDADVTDLGLNLDGTLEVPTDFAETGWYTGRSVPGDPGPSVVVGHVDSWTGPAVFFDLEKLEEGHKIDIDRSDGRVARFRVTSSTLIDKDEFPTVDVYGPTEEPALRLITCGGDFDGSIRSYEGNRIVYAEFEGLKTPPSGGNA